MIIIHRNEVFKRGATESDEVNILCPVHVFEGCHILKNPDIDKYLNRKSQRKGTLFD